MKKQILMIFSVTVLLLTLFSTPNSYGHGFHHDFTPTKKLGDKQVTLKFTSSPTYDPDTNAREISFQLIEDGSEIIIKDTVFHIKATKTNEFIFEYTSEKQNDGILIMELLPTESETVAIEEKKNVISKETPLASPYDMTSIQSSIFDSGGLFYFEVAVLEADNKVLNEPLNFFVQIPFPHKTFHEIEDPNFGHQMIRLVSYFDKSENFQYDPETRTITFDMPFKWTEENINRTSVVHEELTILKTFGDLMVSSYNAYINDVKIPGKLITIDEFFVDGRLVHVILSHNDILELSKRQEGPRDGMRFVIEPSSEDVPFSGVTQNGEFRIVLEPRNFSPNSDAKILFQIYQVFPELRLVETNYELSIPYDDEIILSTKGTTTANPEQPNEIEFSIPDYVERPLKLVFYNIGDNPHAITGIPIAVKNNSEILSSVENTIPDWIRNNAKWWAEGSIGDRDFTSGIQFLIKDGIIQIPETAKSTNGDDSQEIPSWIKNNADWWSQGLISDDDFLKGIQYLVEKGIVVI